MKKQIIILFMVFATMVYSQKSKILGSWLVTKVEVDSEVKTPYMVKEYTEDGKMVMMGIEVGTWDYNKKSNAIVMKSDFDKDFNGADKILKLTKKDLVVEKNGVTVYYEKQNLAEIAGSNKDSGLLGMWVFNDVPNAYTKTYVTFSEPDDFTIIEKQEGMESRIKGTWVFDKQEMSLIMIGLRGEDTFKGKNQIVKIDEKTIELHNGGQVFKATKKSQSTHKIERLTFTQEDFFTEDGDYKYEADYEKLPWQDPLFMMMGLVNVKQLVYNYATLISGTEAFENKLLTADVNANPQELEFNVDNIFVGFDRYTIPDDFGFPSNTDYKNPLYPLEETTFRIVGGEQITTPAGTFDCTVLEVLANTDANKKLWMVNDKIGVYAKIIEDDPDESYGHYYIYELQEIK